MENSGASQVVAALEVIYDPKSDNAKRLDAQKFLDEVKEREESPFWGYEIALNNPQNSILKHFGLGLLVNALKKNWSGYDEEKRMALRKWIIELNYRVQPNDPRYIREKLAFLWVEIAKRIWGEALKVEEPTEEQLAESWVDMDRCLTELWQMNEASRELVLIIFRTLFEDTFLLEDVAVLKRLPIIQPLCIMIVCPMDVFSVKYKYSGKWEMFKSNPEGWFALFTSELKAALEVENAQYIVRLLETLKSCLNWPLSEVIVSNDVFSALLGCLTKDIPKAQSIALDSIHILLTRPYSNTDHYNMIVNRVFDSMGLMDTVYSQLLFDPIEGIDEAKYPIMKKFVDMITCLYTCVLKISDLQNIETYMKLVLKTTYNPSLIVSGLSLDLWCACLRNDEFLPILEKLVIPDLLEFAGNALIYYEQIEDHVSKNFVEVDFQSTAEYENYCSSYRKRIRDIIRLISCVQLDFAYDWLCERLNKYFGSQFGQQVLSSTYLDHKSEPYLSALTQFMIVECFINGCIRWKIWYTDESTFSQKLDAILAKVEMLSNQLLALNLREPLLLKKQIQNFALFLTILKDNVLFTLLEKIITTATLEYPEIDMNEKSEQSDAVRDLRYACGIELNRMALLMPASLQPIYPDLENVVAGILPKLSSHETISFKSFLLTIVLKSNLENKGEKFAQLVDPEFAAWSDKGTVVGLTDLPWFLERLGIVKIAEYFQRRNIDENSDLLSIQMDEDGKKLKADLTQHWQTIFPVRATRMFIHYSMQSVKGDVEFRMLQELWKPRIVPILPYILRLLFQLQSYHNPANWASLPTVVQSFVRVSTVERFWEAGATNKSKDEFIDEHNKALQTVRDFADSVGHIVRYTREYVLLVLASMSGLGSIFFEVDNLANLMMDSIAIYTPDGDISPGVSTHGWKHIINVAVRPILRNCPDECAPKFMSAFLPKLFKTLDLMLEKKWSTHTQSEVNPPPRDEEEMTEEILEENLLRQFTTVVVRLLIDSIGQVGSHTQASKIRVSVHQIKMRKIIFEDINILAPFLRLLNRLVSVRDSKCSFNSILILKSCLSETLAKHPDVDRFYTTEVVPNLIMNVLTQRAFKDSFYEALYAFTVIFLTLSKEYDYFNQFLYELSRGYNIDELYTNLKQVDNYKDQRVVAVGFIDWMKDIYGDQDDSHFTADHEAKTKERREAILARAGEQLLGKNKPESNMLEDPNLEGDVLGGLFDNN